MKKILLNMLILLILIIPLGVCAKNTSAAKELIDINKFTKYYFKF